MSTNDAQVAEIDTLLAEDGVSLDARLVGLIKQIMTVQLPDWKVRRHSYIIFVLSVCAVLIFGLRVSQEASIAQRPSLPKMVDVDWRVDLKASSDEMRKV